MGNLKVSNCEVVFRIDIDFEGCEVDMVYKEMIAQGIQTAVPSILCDGAKIPINKSKLKYTPSADSVDFCLHWLAGFVDESEMCTTKYKRRESELEKIGLKVENWYGLMMGCCHINCSCPPEMYSADLVQKANKIVENVFKKYCIYYDIQEKQVHEQLQLF